MEIWQFLEFKIILQINTNKIITVAKEDDLELNKDTKLPFKPVGIFNSIPDKNKPIVGPKNKVKFRHPSKYTR